MLNALICPLTAVAVICGALLTLWLYPAPTLEIKGQAWCYVGEYKTVGDAPPLLKKLVDVYPGGVRVYGECGSM